MTGPQSTLLLVVTCSRDETRRDLAVATMRNVADLAPAAGLSNRLVVFDNASTFDEHLAHVPPGAVVCRADQNLGYWTAIKWVLDHRTELFECAFRYLYIIESDLVHTDLRPLAACEAFLDGEETASCVRTQEFSVRFRWRFDKRLSFLPFHVTRSHIMLENAVSGEPAWFRKVPGMPKVFLSNLHAKLPALNRLVILDKVFADLAAMNSFTESDFFRLVMAQRPHIGVYDGGLFHSPNNAWKERSTTLSGSYSSADLLTQTGYQTTRTASIMPSANGISVDMNGRARP